jgi:hypothetical protein
MAASYRDLASRGSSKKEKHRAWSRGRNVNDPSHSFAAAPKFKWGRKRSFLLPRGREKSRRRNRRDLYWPWRIRLTSAEERGQTGGNPGKHKRILLKAQPKPSAPRATRKALPHFGGANFLVPWTCPSFPNFSNAYFFRSFFFIKEGRGILSRGGISGREPAGLLPFPGGRRKAPSVPANKILLTFALPWNDNTFQSSRSFRCQTQPI